MSRRRGKPDGRVHVGSMTVADRIRAAVELDMAALLAGLDEPDDELPSEASVSPAGPRELVIGVDIFVMPDGTYSAERPPAYMDAEAMGRHLYRMMLTEVMKRQHPLPCQHDDRFTADPIPIAALAELRTLCDGCPIRGHCAGYANHTHPDAGFWAGRDYTRRTRDEMWMLSTPISPLREGASESLPTRPETTSPAVTYPSPVRFHPQEL